MEKLIKIQNSLKAPKNQRNNFGNYNYRSCEDILEALKPLLQENKCLLTLTDELVNIGQRYYIKATAKFSDGSNTLEVSGYAREEETKKGMDGSQITGASSSYARKYALNALFLIDDTKDSDATNEHDKNEQKPSTKEYKEDNRQWLSDKNYKAAYERIVAGEKELYEKIKAKYKMKKEYSAGLKEAFETLNFDK